MKQIPADDSALPSANSDTTLPRGQIYPGTADYITRACNFLAAGDLVAFPTETVYGLGADATNPEAVAAIYSVKGRPRHNPLIVHLSCLDELRTVADLRGRPDLESQIEKLNQFWPGPLSLVLPRSPQFPGAVSAGLTSIAVRIPRHPVALALIKTFGRPIAAPSANISAYVSPTTAKHVADSLGDKVAMILDGGACRVGIESTIVSLLDQEPRLMRPGGITSEALSAALPTLIVRDPATQEQRTLIAPGMLREHYAPTTPVVFRGDLPVTTFPKKVGLISFKSVQPHDLEFDYVKVNVLSTEGDLESIAAGLFAGLREFDDGSLDLIVVDTCSEVGLGRAIMDRLTRATFRSRNRLKVLDGKMS